MNSILKFFWISDKIVEKIHSITKIPWEESINRLIPFSLPNEGLAFPILLGRLVFLGFLVGLLIEVLHVFHVGKGLPLHRGERKFDAFSLYTLPAAVCLWVEYIIVREFFLGEETIFSSYLVSEIPTAVSMLVHGENLFAAILEIAAGVIVLILALLALCVPLILPGLCLYDLSQTYGKMAILYFVMNVGLHSAVFALFFIALYYGIKSGSAGAVMYTIFSLIVLGITAYIVVMSALLLISVVLFGITGALSMSTATLSRLKVQRLYEEHGERLALKVKDSDGKKKVYHGKEAVEYVNTHNSRFEDGSTDNPFGF